MWRMVDGDAVTGGAEDAQGLTAVQVGIHNEQLKQIEFRN